MNGSRMSLSAWIAVLAVALICIPWEPVLANGDHDYFQYQGLHFSHPLIAESPSPDNKIRFDYFYRDIDSRGETSREHTIRFEGEYAFQRSISIELDVSYLFLDPQGEPTQSNMEDVEIGLKFASFEFEEYNLLLGYGIEIGLPVGDEEKGIGSSHIYVVEPFFDLGYKWEELEIVAFVSFGIPTNQREGEEVETELGYNLSFLYHIGQNWEGLLELDGETVLSGEEMGKSVVNITPGVKARPGEDSDFKLGLGVSIPVSDKELFDIQVIASLFYHF